MSAQYLDYQAKVNLLNGISNLSTKKLGHQVQLQQQHQQQRHVFEHMQMMQQLNSEKAAILNNQINMVAPSPLSDVQEEPSSTQMPLEELDNNLNNVIHNLNNNHTKHFIKTEELILPTEPRFVSSTTGSSEAQIPSSCSYAPVLKFKTMEATILPRAPLAQIENQNKQLVTNPMNTVFSEMNNNIPSPVLPTSIPTSLEPTFQHFVYQSHQEQLQQQAHQQHQVQQQQQQQHSISSTTLREVHTSTIQNILGEISDSTPHSTTNPRDELQFPNGGLPYTGTIYQGQGVLFDDNNLFPQPLSMFLQRMYNNRDPPHQ